MVQSPKECKGCYLEGYFPNANCNGCEKGSKYKPLMKTHAEQINEILKKYQLKRNHYLRDFEIIQTYVDEIMEIDECVNAEG